MATEGYCEHCGHGPTCVVCGRGISNPTPQEAAVMPRRTLETILFRRNFEERNTRDTYWRRIHRYQARRAAGELRYLTNRPRKNLRAGLLDIDAKEAAGAYAWVDEWRDAIYAGK